MAIDNLRDLVDAVARAEAKGLTAPIDRRAVERLARRLRGEGYGWRDVYNEERRRKGRRF